MPGVTEHRDRPIFIAVEGPIGVGKSSLSQYIANHYNYNLLKEIVEENPFLSKFYDNISEWSFQTEMFFLCNRFKQLEDLDRLFLSQGTSTVADYHIFKNMLFAKRTLNLEQYQKYNQIYDILVSDLPKPNLVIYIHASLHTLLHRISIRGRSFEQKMDPSYLQQLCEDYESFMEQFQVRHPDIPVLTFDGDEIDFVNNSNDLTMIFDKIQAVLNKEMTTV